MNFLSEHFAQCSTEHGEVLAVHKYFATIDGSPTGDHTVGVRTLFQTSGMCTVTSKQVKLVETFGVEQGGNALACEQFALFVLALYRAR